MTTLAAGATLRHAAWILRGNPLTAVAAAGALILCLVAAFSPWLVPYDPVASDVSVALQAPSAAHWAGTDQLGRDLLSRIVAATRLDLAIALSAVLLSFAVGAVIGAVCGYAGGRLDRVVGRVVDVLMAFPLFVLAMALVAALGNGSRTSSSPPRSSTCRSTSASPGPRSTCGARPATSRRRGPAARATSRWC